MRIIAPAGLLAFVISTSQLFASEQDANALSQNVRSRHMPYGTVIDPILASPDSDEITGYSRCGDSRFGPGTTWRPRHSDIT